LEAGKAVKYRRFDRGEGERDGREGSWKDLEMEVEDGV